VLAHWEASSWTPLEDSAYGPDGRFTATSQETGFFGVLIPQKRVYLPLVLR
jgi:hypothetical protein